MPGPNSQPKARTRDGRLVTGKTALRRLGLQSGENLRADDVAEGKPTT